MADPQTKENYTTSGKSPLGGSPEEVHRKKVDDAFDLMDRLDSNPSVEAIENGSGRPKRSGKADKAPQSGLRIRFGIDALVSDSDSRAANENGPLAGESTLIDLGITLPYIWRVPLVGKTALKLIRHFQKEDRPSTVRDILKSLRQKSE